MTNMNDLFCWNVKYDLSIECKEKKLMCYVLLLLLFSLSKNEKQTIFNVFNPCNDN